MKRFLKIVKILFVSSLVIFVYGFSANRSAHQKRGKVQIKIINNSPLYITTKTVDKLLKQKLNTVKSEAKDAVFLNDLELAIKANKLVKKADVYIGIDGAIGVLIEQKTPMARILSNTESFYLDTDGDKMPLSPNFSASVPTVTGLSDNDALDAVYNLVKYIRTDSFLSHEIIGIRLNKNKEFELFTRANRAAVLLGDLKNLSRKLNNFKVYYIQSIEKKETNKYKRINLKYSHQVVCTK